MDNENEKSDWPQRAAQALKDLHEVEIVLIAAGQELASGGLVRTGGLIGGLARKVHAANNAYSGVVSELAIETVAQAMAAAVAADPRSASQLLGMVNDLAN